MVDASRVVYTCTDESPIAAQNAVSIAEDACASHTGLCEADALMALKLFGELGLESGEGNVVTYLVFLAAKAFKVAPSNLIHRIYHIISLT